MSLNVGPPVRKVKAKVLDLETQANTHQAAAVT